MQLHRYLFTQYFQVSALVLACLVTVVWINQALNLLELVVNKGAPIIDFMILSVLAAPLWLLEAMPIALFIAILWVISKVQSDRELVVMQAVGVSDRQFALAPITLAFAFTLLQIINSIYVLPASFGEFKQRQIDLRNAIPSILLQDRVFVDLAPGLTIYIDERVSENTVRNVFIQDAREKSNIITLTASTGTFNIEKGRPVLVLENGERSELNDKQDASAALLFKQYKLYFARSIISTNRARSIDMNEESITNLLNPAKSTEKRFISQRQAYAHYRITAPFLSLTLALIALIGMTRGRLRDDHKGKRIWLTIAAALLVETLFITTRSVAVSTPILWPLIYASLTVPSMVSIYLLMISATKFKQRQMV